MPSAKGMKILIMLTIDFTQTKFFCKFAAREVPKRRFSARGSAQMQSLRGKITNLIS